MFAGSLLLSSCLLCVYASMRSGAAQQRRGRLVIFFSRVFRCIAIDSSVALTYTSLLFTCFIVFQCLHDTNLGQELCIVNGSVILMPTYHAVVNAANSQVSSCVAFLNNQKKSGKQDKTPHTTFCKSFQLQNAGGVAAGFVQCGGQEIQTQCNAIIAKNGDIPCVFAPSAVVASHRISGGAFQCIAKRRHRRWLLAQQRFNQRCRAALGCSASHRSRTRADQLRVSVLTARRLRGPHSRAHQVQHYSYRQNVVRRRSGIAPDQVRRHGTNYCVNRFLCCSFLPLSAGIFGFGAEKSAEILTKAALDFYLYWWVGWRWKTLMHAFGCVGTKRSMENIHKTSLNKLLTRPGKDCCKFF